MSLKTIWQWISSNQWSSTKTSENVAIKFYENEHLESVKILIYSDLLLMINQVKKMKKKEKRRRKNTLWFFLFDMQISKEISNLNICQQLIIIDCEETILTLPILLGFDKFSSVFRERFVCACVFFLASFRINQNLAIKQFVFYL